MVLTPENETVRASILHRGSLLSLEGAVSKLLSEEISLNILKNKLVHSNVDTNAILATAFDSAKT